MAQADGHVSAALRISNAHGRIRDELLVPANQHALEHRVLIVLVHLQRDVPGIHRRFQVRAARRHCDEHHDECGAAPHALIVDAAKTASGGSASPRLFAGLGSTREISMNRGLCFFSAARRRQIRPARMSPSTSFAEAMPDRQAPSMNPCHS